MKKSLSSEIGSHFFCNHSFWSGISEIQCDNYGVIPLRFPTSVLSGLDDSASRIARMSAGTSLLFCGKFTIIKIVIQLIDDDSFPSSFDCFQNGKKIDPSHQISAGSREPIQLEWKLLPVQAQIQIVFPTHAVVRILQLETNGSSPLPIPSTAEKAQKWAAYGDSITQGANVTTPSLAWVQQAGWLLGFKPWNFGIGGHGFAEPVVASFLQKLSWDILSIHIGANRIYADDAESYWQRYSDFLTAIRKGQKEKPIICVSPILHREDREQGQSDRINLPKTRQLIHDKISEMQHKDPFLHLIDGRDLLSDPSGYISGDIHLNDIGSMHYASNFATHVKKLSLV